MIVLTFAMQYSLMDYLVLAEHNDGVWVYFIGKGTYRII